MLNKGERGFTLLEIMMVIFIIAILIGVIIPVFIAYRARGYDSKAKSDLRSATNAAQVYYIDHNATYANMNAAALNPIVSGFDFMDGAVQSDNDIYISNVSDATFTLSCRSRSGTIYTVSGSGTLITFSF